MLAVLEQAQGAGQKAQQDAEIGQGSIFDLDGGAGAAPPVNDGPGAGLLGGRAAHLPIPAEEFEQAELLAVEKEAIGLFISAHPLKPVREALRARADCPLALLADKRDKDWVTVGGIVTEAKRIKTRSGEYMMFATLDDLEGSVEMLVFGKALAEHEAVLAVDRIVLVRGRVDHKEAGKTCLVVQSAELFEPTAEECQRAEQESSAAQAAVVEMRPVRLRVDATRLPASVIEELKHVIGNFPGPAEVVLEMDTTSGPRHLRLGDAYRVAPTSTLRAELEQVLAPALAVA
jgi:DNA polymerase-3 subunit alpha